MSAYTDGSRPRLFKPLISDQNPFDPPNAATEGFVLSERRGALPPAQRSRPGGSEELQALFNSVEHVESALIQERAVSKKLKDELASLQGRFARELRSLEEQVRTTSAREGELRARVSPYQESEKILQGKLRGAVEELSKVQSELQRVHLEHAEDKKRIRFEMDLNHSATEYAKQHAKRLQQTVEDLRIQTERTREDTEQKRRAALAIEGQLREAITAHESRQASLVNELARARAELDRYKAAWADAVKAKKAADRFYAEKEDLRRQLNLAEEESERIKNSLVREKRRQQELEEMLENERNEKHMLLTCLKNAEHKITATEAQVSRLMDHDPAQSARSYNDPAQSARSYNDPAQSARAARFQAEPEMPLLSGPASFEARARQMEAEGALRPGKLRPGILETIDPSKFRID